MNNETKNFSDATPDTTATASTASTAATAATAAANKATRAAEPVAATAMQENGQTNKIRTRRKRIALTSEKRSQIVKLYLENVKIVDIISKTGASERTVHKVMNEYNNHPDTTVELRRYSVTKLTDDIKKAIKSYLLTNQAFDGSDLHDELLKNNVCDETTVPTTKSITDFLLRERKKNKDKVLPPVDESTTSCQSYIESNDANSKVGVSSAKQQTSVQINSGHCNQSYFSNNPNYSSQQQISNFNIGLAKSHEGGVLHQRHHRIASSGPYTNGELKDCYYFIGCFIL